MAENPYASPRSEHESPSSPPAAPDPVAPTATESAMVAYILAMLMIALMPALGPPVSARGLLPRPWEIGGIAYLLLTPIAALPAALLVGFLHAIVCRAASWRARPLLRSVCSCLSLVLAAIWARTVCGW